LQSLQSFEAIEKSSKKLFSDLLKIHHNVPEEWFEKTIQRTIQRNTDFFTKIRTTKAMQK